MQNTAWLLHFQPPVNLRSDIIRRKTNMCKGPMLMLPLAAKSGSPINPLHHCCTVKHIYIVKHIYVVKHIYIVTHIYVVKHIYIATHIYIAKQVCCHCAGRCSDRTTCPEGNSDSEPYICAHTVLAAHGAAVKEMRAVAPNAKISINLDSVWVVPYTNTPADIVSLPNCYC